MRKTITCLTGKDLQNGKAALPQYDVRGLRPPGREIKALDEAGVDIFHCDIMDSTFVPNITMGLMDLKTIRKYTKSRWTCT